MTYNSQVLGSVNNASGENKEVTVSGMTLVLGGAAVGTYVGFRIGGPMGAAVGSLVGAFVGTLAAGYIKNFKVIIHSSGTVEIEYETRF